MNYTYIYTYMCVCIFIKFKNVFYLFYPAHLKPLLSWNVQRRCRHTILRLNRKCAYVFSVDKRCISYYWTRRSGLFKRTKSGVGIARAEIRFFPYDLRSNTFRGTDDDGGGGVLRVIVFFFFFFWERSPLMNDTHQTPRPHNTITHYPGIII